eukprot:TRINITY_DN20744_c0_g4_i2.p1 TRINITY_DN20744_c0_g4~~TRINITY_DN20744_c0_g4_i2.p1  ORF type:complete len:1026 (+),score=218.71 TRINITY_DN20744_c0_g4_i2:112-3189(+)
MSGGCCGLLEWFRNAFGGQGQRRGPETEEEFKRLIDFLGAVPLFRKLPRAQYPLLARRLRARKWQPGETLLEVGARQTQFCLIFQGSAMVRVQINGKNSDETLRPGDYFGEKCLDQGRERESRAKIVAESGLVTLSISAKEFDEFGLRKCLRFPKRAALGMSDASQGGKAAQPAKTAEQRQFISDALYRNANLRSMVNLREEIVQQLIDAAEEVKVPTGKAVVHRGEWGGWFHIVYSGCFELRLDDPEEQEDAKTVDGARGHATSVDAMVSEMQRRRLRKEGFLHVLLHGEDVEFMAHQEEMESPKHCDSMFIRTASDGDGTTSHCVSPHAHSRPRRRASTAEMVDRDPGKARLRHSSTVVSIPADDERSSPTTATSPSDALLPDAPPPTPASTRSKKSRSTLAIATSTSRMSLSISDDESLSPRSTRHARGWNQHAGEPMSPVALHNGNGLIARQATQHNNGVLAKRKTGQSFGELALLYNVQRTSTAVAIEDSVVFRVNQAAFRRVMINKQQRKAEQNVDVLDQVDLFQGLLSQERRDLAQNFLTETFKPGDLIVQQGERQDVWYILVSGECEMFRAKGDGDRAGEEEYLATLRPFKYFGERALLRGLPSEFSVRVIGKEDVRCLVLAGPIFHEVVASLKNDPAFRHAVEDDLLRFAEYKAGKDAKKCGFLPRLDEHRKKTPRAADAKGKFSDSSLRLDPSVPVDRRALTRVAMLGTGAYGVVTLEKDPATGQLFALKTLSKGLIVQNKLQENVNSERELLTMVDTPFSISLYGTFKDAKYIYFLFEPLLGGDLHDHLHREPASFRTPRVHTFVVGCMALALEHLHERNIVFRDLKPENIILSRDGYPKLCDYGFAKFVLHRAMTLCGTPEYVAPEVIGHSGYDRMVDWWALGVLTYELITGLTPFCDEDDEDAPPVVIFFNIRRGIQEVKFPFRLPDAISFIKALCKANPSQRLGVGGPSHVMHHPFFKELDFTALKKLELPAPYVPKMASDDDICFPCSEDQEMPPCPDYEDDGTNWDDEF